MAQTAKQKVDQQKIHYVEENKDYEIAFIPKTQIKVGGRVVVLELRNCQWDRRTNCIQEPEKCPVRNGENCEAIIELIGRKTSVHCGKTKNGKDELQQAGVVS